jgi:hypothetical protein|tara:strand:- start:189 stop:1118 length:930 start_codon:yes stop_codon:yes gene_type:complete
MLNLSMADFSKKRAKVLEEVIEQRKGGVSIDKDIKNRVEDAGRPVLTMMDSLETTLHGAYELGNNANIEFVQSMIAIEKSIQDSELNKQAEKIRQQFAPSPAMTDFIEKQREGQQRLLKTFKPLIDAQKTLREQALKLAFPDSSPTDVIKKVFGIVESQQQYHVEKLDQLHEKVEQLEVQKMDMEQEVWKAEMDVAHIEEMRLMALIGKSDYTNKFVKQAKRDMQPYEIITSKKAGKTYLTTAQKDLLEDLRPYFNRDFEGSSDWDEKRFDTGDRDYHHENQFRNLARKYGITVDGIKKFAQKHDPSKK